jgi:DNA-binding FrmR family transcriptional regulator
MCRDSNSAADRTSISRGCSCSVSHDFSVPALMVWTEGDVMGAFRWGYPGGYPRIPPRVYDESTIVNRRTAVQLDSEDLAPVINRLKRAQGQLAAVTRMLEEDRDCKEVVTQLAAVSKALDRAGFAIIASGLEQCIVREDTSMDKKELEKLFLSLA